MRAAPGGRWAFLGFAVALLLSLAGLCWPRGEEPGSDRVVMIGVRGLSWQVVVKLIEEGSLPTLSALIQDGAAIGDIITDGYDGEGEVLASIMTGRLPFKQPSRTVWEELQRQAQKVTVGELSSAAQLLREEPDHHLSLYMSGLRDGNGEPLRQGYEMLDELLERLVAADDGDSTFLLFSEVGFFLAWGNHVKQAVQPHLVAPVDLAPTLLHVGGAKIPNDMDGLVLFQVFDDGFYHKRRLAFRP